MSSADQGPAPTDADTGERSRDADAQRVRDADAQRVRDEAAAYSSERRAERGRTSWQSMLISMAIVVGIVLVLLMLVVRVSSVTQPPVDVARGAQVAATRVEFTPSVPAGLPADWRATSVRTTRSTAEVITWHAGFVTGANDYAALEQGQDAPAEWVRAQVNRAREDGTQQVSGQAWQRYVREDKVQNSLVHTRGAVTTIVTGTAGFDDLALLAASLRPAG